MGRGRKEPLLPSKEAALAQSASQPDDDELQRYRSCLRWMCMDQSDALHAAISWSLFFLLAIAVPAISYFLLEYSEQRRPYSAVVQLSLTAASSLAFLCLSASLRKHGLRRFLFLDKAYGESERVRFGYSIELRRSFRMLSYFVMPCFLVELGYKVWWYLAGARQIPFVGNKVASDAFACTLELASWIYRTAIFYLVCMLFHLICHLQILRLQEFAEVFHEESEVAVVLSEHLRIRKQLMIISHRFRKFIITGLVIVTVSQFAALLLTTRRHAIINLSATGELALCSIVLVTGLLICLRSAAKITHKAQALTSHAAKWHLCATIESDNADNETPCEVVTYNHEYSDDDEEEEDELGCTKIIQPHANTISFQKRQALVTYLENNVAGITLFGFSLDRGYLYNTIFTLELSLVLWLLGKTVGIS